MRNFRRDDKAETVFPAFVMLLGVMALFSVVTVSLLNQMNSSAENVNSGAEGNAKPEDFSLGGYEYTLIDPTAGYVVTTALTVDEMERPYDANFIFSDPAHNDDKKYVQVVRDNVNWDPTSNDMWKKYKDFISIQRHTSPSLLTPLNYKWNGAIIPFEKITAEFDMDTNIAIIHFDLSGYNDTVFVQTPGNDSASIWANDFTMYYGFATLRASKVDLWHTISMVLTAQIPGLDPRLQFIVSSFWGISLIFVAFTLASRIIPTLGGG